MFRSLLLTWLQNAAKAKLRDTVVQAARGQLASATPSPPAEAPKPCHLGFVFALGIESGCLEDMLQGALSVRGNGFAPTPSIRCSRWGAGAASATQKPR